ncbi:MAG TPA: hypothetical protein VKE72_10250 [Methylocella sp.]|nr:hypothetical protein [Methylocella sp.]
MNRKNMPGIADPANELVPFGKFPTLHFARFVILEDQTLEDLKVFGPAAEFPDAPVYLAFFGDCDGSADMLLADFANLAGAGLRQIFAYCEGFDPNCDLLRWMQAHSVKPSITYFNCLGRTVRQIHEEARLAEVLRGYLAQHLNKERGDFGDVPKPRSLESAPQKLRAALICDVKEKGPVLTPPAPTPLLWYLYHRLPYHLAVVLIVILVLLPLVTLPLASALKVYAVDLLIIAAALALFLVRLRRQEIEDPEILTPITNAHLQAIGEIDDYDVTNQYTVVGSFVPGLFARWTTAALWWLLAVASPVLYPCGNLGRIKTIHSARWVFLDGKRRALFASNYDGSDEAYMDDFVNKVPFGLNIAFALGLSFPKTYFLLWEGAYREQEFKNTQNRHELPTEVWYKAYPGLNLVDIARNTRIRSGLERETMTDTEIRRWLSEM